MPYASNDDLPAYVKKLPPAKQSQWRAVFNSCMKDGRGESQCFAMANGVAKKSVKDFEAEGDVVDELTAELAERLYQASDEGEAPAEGELIGDELSEAKMARTQMQASSFAYIDSHGGRHLPINDAAHVRNALARFSQTQFESDAAKSAAMRKIRAAAKRFGVEVGGGKKQSFGERVLSAIFGARANPSSRDAGAGEAGAPPTPRVKGPVPCLSVIKQADGRMRWFARYSNAWEDRDKEILTEASHKEYIGWADANKLYPELWVWHTPGTRFGQADWLDFSDGFALASGLVDEGEAAERVVNFLQEKAAAEGGIGVSHGFVTADGDVQGKYINRYRTFEISVLPLERAAVWSTDFNIVGLVKEAEAMSFSADRRKWLVDALGEDTVGKLEANTSAVANQLKELGIEYKESAEASASAEAASGEAFKTLAGQVTALTGAVTQLASAVGVLQKDVAKVKQSDDEKIEDAFIAKVAKAFGQTGAAGTRPTASRSNVVSADKAAAAGAGAPAGGDGGDFLFAQLQKELFGIAANGGSAPALAGAGTGVATVTVSE